MSASVSSRMCRFMRLSSLRDALISFALMFQVPFHSVYLFHLYAVIRSSNLPH